MVSGCCESQLPKNSLKHTSQKAARKSRKETGLVQQRRRRRRTAERISVIIKMTFSVMDVGGQLVWKQRKLRKQGRRSSLRMCTVTAARISTPDALQSGAGSRGQRSFGSHNRESKSV